MLWLWFVSAAAAGSWPDLPAPTPGSGGDGTNDAAVVIAIEDYLLAPDVPSARENGTAWVDWLVTARKVPVVKPLFDVYATREQILADVAGMSAEVGPGGRLWVVFIGHGAPSKDGKDGLLEGVDVQQTALSLETRGVRRSELLSALEEHLPSGSSAVVVLDACFSGQTAAGDLAPKLSPLRDVSFVPSERVTFLTAAANNEYAGPLSDGSRPAFSYLVLGAMRGWSDNGDGKVMASEAVAYSKRALITTIVGRQQTPSVSGPDVVLASAKAKEGPNLSGLAGGMSATVARTAEPVRAEPALRPYVPDESTPPPENKFGVPSNPYSTSEWERITHDAGKTACGRSAIAANQRRSVWRGVSFAGVVVGATGMIAAAAVGVNQDVNDSGAMLGLAGGELLSAAALITGIVGAEITPPPDYRPVVACVP